MTKEELKTHCEKQTEMCESWAIGKGEKPSGKIYEEHKLILELLEQNSYYKDLAQSYEKTINKLTKAIVDQADVFDEIIAEIEHTGAYEQEVNGKTEFLKGVKYCLDVINKYKAKEGDEDD